MYVENPSSFIYHARNEMMHNKKYMKNYMKPFPGKLRIDLVALSMTQFIQGITRAHHNAAILRDASTAISVYKFHIASRRLL